MNCPACNAPLFGGNVCGCGYTHTRKLSSIDLSYPEALVAYWRIYWPTQLFGIISYLPFHAWLRVPGRTYLLQANGMSTAALFLLQAALGAIGLFLFVHRVISSEFRKFSIQMLVNSTEERAKLTMRRRSQIWFFVWWRQVVAGFLAMILAAPLNTLISLIGLRTVLGVNVAFWISILGVVLAAGPIILKMLIGQQFGDFRFEVKRFFSDAEAATSTPSQVST